MKKTIILLLIFCSGFAFGQKMKLLSGNFDFLKNEQKIKVEFTSFSNTKFYKENMSEQAYIEKRKKEIMTDKGEDEYNNWLKDWKHTKDHKIKEKFFASFNKHTPGIKAVQDSKTAYTMIVETTWIYPGWFGGVMHSPSKVNTLIKFVETKKPSNILAELECIHAIGDNFVGLANNNDRIAEAYSKTAKSLLKFIAKKS